MEKPRCQGCLGELKVERPEGTDPYVWCLRCGARDERDTQRVIAQLEQADDGDACGELAGPVVPVEPA